MKRKTRKKRATGQVKKSNPKTVGEVIKQYYPDLINRLSEYNRNRA